MKFSFILCFNLFILTSVECGFLKDLFDKVEGEVNRVKEDIHKVKENVDGAFNEAVDSMGKEATKVHDGISNIIEIKKKFIMNIINKDKKNRPGEGMDTGANVSQPPTLTTESNTGTQPGNKDTTTTISELPVDTANQNNLSADDSETLENLTPLIDIRFDIDVTTPKTNNNNKSSRHFNHKNDNGESGFVFSEESEKSDQNETKPMNSNDENNQNKEFGQNNTNKQLIEDTRARSLDINSKERNSHERHLIHAMEGNTTEGMIFFPGRTNTNEVSTASTLKPETTKQINTQDSDKNPISDALFFNDNLPQIDKVPDKAVTENLMTKRCPKGLVKTAKGDCLKPVIVNLGNKNDTVAVPPRNNFVGGCPTGTGRAADNSCQDIVY